MIRNLILILTLFCTGLLYTVAQDFTFVNTSTVLNKSVIQSPAHWYLECTNHTDRVLNLRWKAHLISIPSAWDIQMNDQTNNVVNIQDGDESDFDLEIFDVMPMKMVISAVLNNTIGNGTASFDVWDPLVPNYVQTINYIFNISPHILDVEELESSNFFYLSNGKLKSTNGEVLTVSVYNALGQVIFEATDVLEVNLLDFEKDSMKIVNIAQGNSVYQLKLL